MYDVPLKKVFVNYCSYGDPMNTRYLKSSKIVRLLKECGLLKDVSEVPRYLEGRAQ